MGLFHLLDIEFPNIELSVFVLKRGLIKCVIKYYEFL